MERSDLGKSPKCVFNTCRSVSFCKQLLGYKALSERAGRARGVQGDWEGQAIWRVNLAGQKSGPPPPPTGTNDRQAYIEVIDEDA